MLKYIGQQAPPLCLKYGQQVRTKSFIPRGGKSLVPRRVPRKLRVGDVRPAVYHKFEQVIELSDGSTIKRQSQFPRLEWKYLSDQRNTPLWNPSFPDLQAQKLDEAGRLAKFRKRFGNLDDDGGLDDLLNDGAEQITSGRLATAPKKKKK